MKKKPEWTFPDLPPFLTGLTLEIMARMRAFTRRHGMLLGVSPQGEVRCLKVREPAKLFLIVIGSTDDAVLIVAPHDELDADGHTMIAIVPGGETVVSWSPKISLADVLECLSADVVVKTSQHGKSGKEGPN